MTAPPSTVWPSTYFRPFRKTIRSLGLAAHTSASTLIFDASSRNWLPASVVGGSTARASGGGTVVGATAAVAPAGGEARREAVRGVGTAVSGGDSTGIGRAMVDGSGVACWDRAGGGGWAGAGCTIVVCCGGVARWDGAGGGDWEGAGRAAAVCCGGVAC